MSNSGSLLGWVLMLVICLWAIWFLAKKLRSMIESRVATDRTLELVDEEDHPRLFWLEVIGLILAIIGSILVAACAVFSLVVSRS